MCQSTRDKLGIMLSEMGNIIQTPKNFLGPVAGTGCHGPPAARQRVTELGIITVLLNIDSLIWIF